MAEGWARSLHSNCLEPYSAGVSPGEVNPRAIQVMSEVGVDISGYRSKHINELLKVDFDYVVTVCDNARQSCPIYPGKAKVLHHEFDDPPHLALSAKDEDEVMSCYRRVRDEIGVFVENIFDYL